MADFLISTEELRRAAENLRRASDLVEPQSGHLVVSSAVLGSDDVHQVMHAASLKLTAKARRLANDLDGLSMALTSGADAVEQQDEQLAERFEQ
jgi:hypothetical protein